MRQVPYKNTNRIIIEPGEFYVSHRQEVISTLLGSCVAACLYDPLNGITGMNHFLLADSYSNQAPIHSPNSGRYGLPAMKQLINEMIKRGAKKSNLHAKCFGGGNVVLSKTQKQQTVGDRNVVFVKKYLQQENIPIVSAALGGTMGRIIHFMGTDYTVLVDEIEQNLQRLSSDKP